MRATQLPAPKPRGVSPAARSPSVVSTAIATIVSTAPAIIMMWVGPQRVTSWPNSRCQRSSRGNPDSAKLEHSSMSAPPTGIRPRTGRLIAVALRGSSSLGSDMARSPAAKIP